MKKTILLALPLLILMACTQEHPIDLSEEISQQSVRSMPRKWGDETLGIDTAAFKAIAQKLVMSEMPLSVCEDVHQITQNSLEVGIGEVCYLKEVISDSTKMWIPESTATKNFFNNLLKFSFTGQSTDSIYITPEILDKVQIYWPYSENWDGVTMPLITWYGERANATTNFAYTYYNGQLRRIRVDDEYAKDKPVWVINSSMFPHSCFPQVVSSNPNSRLLGETLIVELNECQMQFIRPDRIPKYVGDEGANSGGGGSNTSTNNFITHESQIDLSKGYYIYIGAIKIQNNDYFHFDEDNLHLYVDVRYINSNRVVSIPNTIIIPILKTDIGKLLYNIPTYIFAWNPNAQDVAIVIRNTNNKKLTDSNFTGTLSYKENYIYSSANFSIEYHSSDYIHLMRTYTKSEFFTNDIIQHKKSSEFAEWQFYLEPYTIFQPTWP